MTKNLPLLLVAEYFCLLIALVAITVTNAQTVVVPPECAPQRTHNGMKGSYEPTRSIGAKVYRSGGSMTDYPLLFEEFNRSTRYLGPLVSFLKSPYETEPEESRLEVLGVINRTGHIVPEPATGAGRLLRTDDDGGERKLNVFLPDSRTEVEETAWPYRMVGKWGGCTATLVYGSGIIVTNSHCLTYLPNGDMDPAMWDRTFYAALNKGAFLESSKARAIYFDKGDDFAVILLWKPLEQKLGRFGVWWRAESFFKSTDRPLRMISYSGDHCASFDTCRQKESSGKSRGTKVIGNDVKHDLDATRGSSGSAMFMYYNGFPVMDALNFGEDRNGGDKSLTISGGYDWRHPNFAKPAGVWKVGYDTIMKQL